ALGKSSVWCGGKVTMKVEPDEVVLFFDIDSPSKRQDLKAEMISIIYAYHTRISKNSGRCGVTSNGLRPLRSRLRYLLQSKCTSSQQYSSVVTKTASQGFSLSSTLLQTKHLPMPASTARSNHW